MKLAGAVVLYHPEEEILENINSYLEELDILYVLDNSDCKNIKIVENIKKIKKCRYKDMQGNKGIACALNRALRCAEKADCEWLLTMDQDSKFCGENLHKMKEYIIQSADEKTAIVCARYKDYKDKRNKCPKDVQYVMEAITSGSIMNVAIAKAVGGFLNKLFIDHVDNEFCCRLILGNYKIVKMNNVIFEHKEGNQTINENNVLIYNYAPIRYYYRVRNACYIIKTYKNYKKLKITCENRKDGILTWIVRASHEKNKFQKYGYIILGYIHFRLGIMGKLRFF